MKFLSKVIIWAYGTYKKLTSISNYAVIEKALEYTVRTGVRYEIDDDFWLAEEKYWDLDTEEGEDHHYVIVTDRDFTKTVIPQNVVHPILRIKYYYNNKRYKLVTDDIDYTWPPREEEGAMFILPITSAILMDHDDKPVRDITEKIRRCLARGKTSTAKATCASGIYCTTTTRRSKRIYRKLKLQTPSG